MARKLAALRLWEDEAGRRWARSASDLGLEILCVSQFTLYHTMKGNKPDFRQAMSGAESRLLYQVRPQNFLNHFIPLFGGLFFSRFCWNIQSFDAVLVEPV